jgi:alpha-L-fucosidase
MSDWFQEARFGLFVHWSHCSQLGCDLSWPLVGGVSIGGMSSTAIPIDTYHAGADTFCPEPLAARRWAALAAAAGARYAVLTTKHHDGFALWPSALSDWTIARTPYRGDLVGEFVDACRAEGLRVGLYHSLSDWHHPDYPAFTEADKPYAAIGYRRPGPEAWERYLAVLHGQVRELLTGYGDVDVLWFDGQWERTADEWRAADLRAMIRELQPSCLVNDRLPVAADFETPEQFLPPVPPGGRWEMCLTMGGSWGYRPDDAYKSPATLVRTLCEVAGKGGNLLLNVGPGPDGALPTPQVERLDAVAGWMERHAEAIHGTEPGLEPWQWYGPSTRRDDRAYLMSLARPHESVTIRGVPVRRIARVLHLASGEELPYTTRMSVLDELMNADPVGEVTVAVRPDQVDHLATVLALDVEGGFRS